ncbi:Aste57867_9722 [Aphanomyces stellatus]|uniref:Aste57867_9722 protein n=1 Tax=Aphanomyces stellatus TaxID=120398 RepID=A0A485KNL7_9STRA|nr:hypothetical protein As57867_009684 [Aphanomyces stellatus]VFT86601.1 Aste57867_9722 [Aphanomyces stellatus]
MAYQCFFNGCNKEASDGTFKCLFHIHRGRCLVEDCRNQVYARNLCVRHGGKKQCAFDGCEVNSRVGNFCTKHSPTHLIRMCSYDGCDNQAHLKGKCFRHGGSRFCKVEGCVTYARNRGFCARHTVANKSPVSSPRVKLEPPSSPTMPCEWGLKFDTEDLDDVLDLVLATNLMDDQLLSHQQPSTLDWGEMVALLAEH